MDVEQRARELYAAQYQTGRSRDAARIADMSKPLSTLDYANQKAIRALMAALTPPEGYVLVPVDVQKDAERYRWLRDSAPEEWDVTRWLDNDTQELHVQDYLDEAIDSAMLAARPEVKS